MMIKKFIVRIYQAIDFILEKFTGNRTKWN